MNTGYSQAEQALDAQRVNAALTHIAQECSNYSDVVVVPQVITIHDVCAIALDTTYGPLLVGDVCSREEIVHILRAFQNNPCGDLVLVAQYALNDYRETHPVTKE